MTESLLDTQNLPPIQVDPNKNYLVELVGEGKKFKSPEELARGKFEADTFIEAKNRQYDNLVADYKKLRDEYNAGPKLQEVVDKLLAAQTSSSTNTKPNEDTTEPPVFDPSKITSLVKEEFAKTQTEQKALENWNIVKAKLQEKFGERFPEMVATQTQKLGLTADRVNDLARTAPQAFFKVMGLDEPANNQDNFQAPPASSRRSDNFSNNSGKRTLSYYENLRKDNPRLYYDKKIAVQMDKDCQALGKAFFDVN